MQFSYTILHQNRAKWNDTLRLINLVLLNGIRMQIALQDLYDSHFIRTTLRRSGIRHVRQIARTSRNKVMQPQTRKAQKISVVILWSFTLVQVPALSWLSGSLVRWLERQVFYPFLTKSYESENSSGRQDPLI